MVGWDGGKACGRWLVGMKVFYHLFLEIFISLYIKNKGKIGNGIK